MSREARTVVLVVVLGLASGLATPTEADRGGSEVEARLRAMRAEILRRRVGLDEARAARVERVLDRFDPERRALKRRARDAHRELRRLVEAGSPDERAYAEGVARMMQAHRALGELRQRMFEEVARHLSPREQAALLLALREMRQRAQRELGGRSRRGGRHGED